MAALQQPGSDDATSHSRCFLPQQLQKSAPDILRRYLATSASWRLYREHGSVYATRRWMIGSQWHYTLNGNYTDFSIDWWHKTGIPRFQTQLTLVISGRPWWGGMTKVTTVRPGETATLQLFTDNEQPASQLLIPVEDKVLSVFEQSSAKERRLTKAALGFSTRNCARW